MRLFAFLPVLVLAAFPAAALEIATACRAQNLRLAGSGGATLLIWQDGSEKGDAKKGCKGETRAAWLQEDEASELPADFLGPGFRAAGSGARATALANGRLLVVWAEGGNIEGALLAPAATKPEKRFPVSPADLASDVAAPRPLAAGGGGFLVVYESDFFSGRRRNPVWRAFGAEGDPKGEIQPACADFVTVRDPLAARLESGSFAVAGPGIGPLGDSFFVQFLGSEGELLGEPLPGDEKNRVLGGDLAALGENYVFTWNIRAGKTQKAFVRLHAADGAPVGKPRELGPTAGPPSLATGGGGALVAWIDPTPERQVRLLRIGESVANGEVRNGPALPEGVDEIALGGQGPLLAWAEKARIVAMMLPAGD